MAASDATFRYFACAECKQIFKLEPELWKHQRRAKHLGILKFLRTQ